MAKDSNEKAVLQHEKQIRNWSSGLLSFSISSSVTDNSWDFAF